MLLSGQAHVVTPGEGRIVDLGVTRMRVLAAGGTTGRTFTLAEFAGDEGHGPCRTCTAPWRSRSSYSKAASRSASGTRRSRPVPGSYVLVPRETRHVLAAHAGGGRCLVLMVPGGEEDMFYELGELGADSLRDPAVRAAISGRYDSVPVR